MNSLTQVLVGAAVGAAVFMAALDASNSFAEPATNSVEPTWNDPGKLYEFTCYVRDDEVERWVGLSGVSYVGSGVWVLTTHDNITSIFRQAEGTSCTVDSYEVEDVPTISSVRA